MRTKRIRRSITLALVMVLMAAGAAFAGVGGSDVPTVPGHVEVGETGIPFSYTITNQSTDPNQVNNMILTNFFFVTTCGSALTPGVGCLPGDQEAPNTIVINPLIATGVAGACTGQMFTVIPTANPNEYEFVPANPILIGPSNGSGISSECEVAFTVDVLVSPTKDALPGTNGLQTAQLARVTMTDAVTAETGFAAGSSTVNVFEHCLHVEKDCTDAPTCEGAIGVSVTATNCGTEGLTDLLVTDDQAGALSCLATTLAAGESTTCTGSYSNTPGTYTDIITASAVSAISQEPVLPDATSILTDTCDIPPAPTVTATKSCLDAASCDAGQIEFTITVTNGAVPVTSAIVDDADCGIAGMEIGPLAAGQVVNVQCIIAGTPGSTVTNSGGLVTVTANGCTASDAIETASCNIPDCPCSLVIEKTVALDDNCDGVADDPFVDDVTQDAGECVVYQICVTNTGEQVLDAAGVTVSDAHLGVVDFNFGTIAVGAPAVCQLVPSAIPAVQCPNSACVCEDVQGTNTAVISSAVCEITQTNACDEPGSICSDTANVTCLTQVGLCRMTGGHNVFTSIDGEFVTVPGGAETLEVTPVRVRKGNKFDLVNQVVEYTTGGQIGAPSARGCRPDCESLEPQNGRASECPWGEWQHTHHQGVVGDFGSTKAGTSSFGFHSGTASAPDEAFIQNIICDDPGWCVQARCAPDKQIFWEGTGVFHTVKNIDQQSAFGQCVTVGTKHNEPSIHYYRAHVGDFGEPGGNNKQVDESSCTWSNSGGVSISSCNLTNATEPISGIACSADSECGNQGICTADQCVAQDPFASKGGEICAACPDWYEIEIHCTADPNSAIIYKVGNFIRKGNFQIHPEVGSNCADTFGIPQ